MIRLTIVLLIVLFACRSGYGQAAAPQVTEESVKSAIDKAVAYIYSVANADGVWDPAKQPDFKAIQEKSIGGNLLEPNWPGQTALVLNALAAAGQQRDPRFKKALEWLMKQEMIGTYGLGMRMELIHRLRDSKPYKDVLKKDAIVLGRSLRRGKEGAMWQYVPPPTPTFYSYTGDFSNTNYGVLGLWAATEERMEIADAVWKALESTYVTGQNADGSWAYYHSIHGAKGLNVGPSASMTTAGIASLFIILDQRHTGQGALGSFRKVPAYKAIQAGTEWLGKNFSDKTNPGWPEFASYYFYNCERVAQASGVKYFGTHDWFREIAATILARQAPNGSISFALSDPYGGLQCDTAFCLLFLTKGSAPVLFNKLQHAGDWDNHLRDLGVLTEWIAHESERPANWQVVRLDAPVEELTDSRILYIAGTKPLAFTLEEKAKLKRYVELGGTLVFHPDATNSSTFEMSAGKLLSELWPTLKLTPVKWDSHPLGNIYEPIRNSSYHVRQFASPARVFAFVLLGEPAAAWEDRRRATTGAFPLGANLNFYVNDSGAGMKDMPTKLTYFGEPFRKPAPQASRGITLGRLRYGEDPLGWNPEPLAFERFSRLTAEREKVAMEIKPLAPSDLATSGAKIAHLTGTSALPWTKDDWAPIRAWLAGGGTLIVDQAGGPQLHKNVFDESFRKLLAEEYGPDALAPLAADSPLLKDLEKLSYRRLDGLRRSWNDARLEALTISGRPAILYSRYDLTCGLSGTPNPLVSGLEEASATRLMSRLISGVQPAPATQPAPVGAGG